MEYVFSLLILSLSIILSYKIKNSRKHERSELFIKLQPTIWYVNDIKREILTRPQIHFFSCTHVSIPPSSWKKLPHTKSQCSMYCNSEAAVDKVRSAGAIQHSTSSRRHMIHCVLRFQTAAKTKVVQEKPCVSTNAFGFWQYNVLQFPLDCKYILQNIR